MELQNVAEGKTHTLNVAYDLQVDQYNRLEYFKTGRVLCRLHTITEPRGPKEWEGDQVFILTYSFGGKQVLRVMYDSFNGALHLMADAILNTLLGNAMVKTIQEGDYQLLQDLNAQRNRLLELVKAKRPDLEKVASASLAGPFDAAAMAIEGK